MKPKMKTETVLTVLKVIALIALFFYGIFCVLYLVFYVGSLFNVQPFSNNSMALAALELKEQNFLKYSISIVWLIVVAALKANVWYRAIQIIQKIKMENPFTMRMTRRLEKISYILLNIWILGYIGSTFSFWLTNHIETANFLGEQLSTQRLSSYSRPPFHSITNFQTRSRAAI